MGLSSSLYAGISGLSTMGNAMSVLGDNVANVNTTAFKSSRATFQDVLSQSLATSAGSAQVGRGVTLTAVDGLFAQGSFESTSTATDLAIGGEGFFMLRSADSAEANMYTRAGEFRFNTQGDLISPTGHFVQGWTINSETGQIQGTIGDINLGKSTPPVATQHVDVIVNVDSRTAKETTETRLFDAWNGTNLAQANPTDPIDSANYEYTTAIKVYDSKGAAHDVTVYFDRTTQENQWEFLVTCEPSEDLRLLDTREQAIYAPNENYNYEQHKGAGALLYGVIDFNTSGAITKINAWDVPPDGKVDPAQNTNRVVLESTDGYYSFNANFTGASTDQAIDLNFGARYSGLITNQTQVLVSDKGAYADQNLGSYITKETLWNSVYDAGGNAMADGDFITWSGYKNDGTDVSGSYRVVGTAKVQALLDALGSSFGATATVDQGGKIRLIDATGGESGMFVTGFVVSAASEADPFGGGSAITNNQAYTATGARLLATGNLATDPTALLTTIGDNGTGQGITVGDTFTFTGNHIGGAAIVATNVFTVGAGSTVQNLLDFMAALYEDGNSTVASTGLVQTFLNTSGQLRVIDTTGAGEFSGISAVFADVDVSGFTDAWGGTGGVNIFTAADSVTGRLNVTTSKREVVSPGRALTSNSGAPPVVSATTTWDTVYSDDGASGTQVADGNTIIFSGTKQDGTTVAATTYTIATTDGSTIQDLLDDIETAFDADAFIDGAGRLVLRSRTSDSATATSNLAFQISAASTAPSIFGAEGTNFATISGDLTEDGSRMGAVVSDSFESEALASSQYANSSTTIYQDQDGYAAGFLQSVAVNTDGIITGNYSNGQVLQKAQVALASFSNVQGLNKEGGNIFRATTESGAPVTGTPGTNGLGSIAPNSLEQSNVDLGTEFVKLITTQRGFQANSKIITTTDEMLQDLINIKR